MRLSAKIAFVCRGAHACVRKEDLTLLLPQCDVLLLITDIRQQKIKLV